MSDTLLVSKLVGCAQCVHCGLTGHQTQSQYCNQLQIHMVRMHRPITCHDSSLMHMSSHSCFLDRHLCNMWWPKLLFQEQTLFQPLTFSEGRNRLIGELISVSGHCILLNVRTYYLAHVFCLEYICAGGEKSTPVCGWGAPKGPGSARQRSADELHRRNTNQCFADAVRVTRLKGVTLTPGVRETVERRCFRCAYVSKSMRWHTSDVHSGVDHTRCFWQGSRILARTHDTNL